MTAEALAAIVRHERTRLVATLVRRFGFDVAEESVDAAVAAAIEQWPARGIPASPRAWLLEVARRRAVDRVRHEAMAGAVHDAMRAFGDEAHVDDADEAFPDDRLRLVFTCCHPAIAPDAQVALALRWLSGLTTEEVARAFCVPVATMAQRLTRAKAKIEVAGIPYEVPERSELPERVAAVLEVLYAIFNEGYVATEGRALSRVDLAEEAIRLAELVVLLLPESADAKAMLALLLLVHARRDTREVDGELVALEDQDRARWDHAMIARGRTLLETALASGPPSLYAIEAAIQAVHGEAPSFAATDFRQIVALYDLLVARGGTPLVRVNRAVARSWVEGPATALDELLAIADLPAHPAVFAAKADLFRRTGDVARAREAYASAIAATKNDAERRFLRRRAERLDRTAR